MLSVSICMIFRVLLHVLYHVICDAPRYVVNQVSLTGFSYIEASYHLQLHVGWRINYVEIHGTQMTHCKLE